MAAAVLGEVEGGADVGQGPMRGEQIQELVLVAAHLLRGVRAEVAHLEADDVDALEQHEVERDAGNHAGRVADGHEATSPPK